MCVCVYNCCMYTYLNELLAPPPLFPFIFVVIVIIFFFECNLRQELQQEKKINKKEIK